jgi:hypothetical protein
MAIEQTKEYWNSKTKTLTAFAESAAIPAGYRLIPVRNTPETALSNAVAGDGKKTPLDPDEKALCYVLTGETVTLYELSKTKMDPVRDANNQRISFQHDPKTSTWQRVLPSARDSSPPLRDEDEKASETADPVLQLFTPLGSDETCWHVGKPLTEEESLNKYGLRLSTTHSLRPSSGQTFKQFKRYVHSSDAQQEEPVIFYFGPNTVIPNGFTPAGLKGANNFSNLNEVDKSSNTFGERYSALPTRRKVVAALAITLSLALIVLAAIPAHILAGTFLDWAAPLAPLLGGAGFLGLFFTVAGHWIDIALESKDPAELGQQLKRQPASIQVFRSASGFLFIVGAALLLASFVAPLLGAPAAFSGASRLFGPALMGLSSLGILISIFVPATPSRGGSPFLANDLLKTLYTQWQNMRRAVRYIPAAIILLTAVAFTVLKFTLPSSVLNANLLWGMSVMGVSMLAAGALLVGSVAAIFGYMLLQPSSPAPAGPVDPLIEKPVVDTQLLHVDGIKPVEVPPQQNFGVAPQNASATGQPDMTHGRDLVGATPGGGRGPHADRFLGDVQQNVPVSDSQANSKAGDDPQATK